MEHIHNRAFSSRRRLTIQTLLVLFAGLLSQHLAAQTVSVWLTKGNQTQLLQQQGNLNFGNNGSYATTISVNEGTTYQTMDGFGASMTGSSAFVINSMTSTSKNNLLNDLFSSSGIRLTFIRHTIGASDFSRWSYTYNDMPSGQTDPNLNNFNLGADWDHIIPMIQQARNRNGQIKIMGSPWSAPAWMKENGSLNGGWLNVGWYNAYANYLVKYVQAYQAAGIPIYAITLQNEPLHETGGYPSMRMDPANQANFVKNDLGPAFSNAGLSTKLICYDHNWDQPNYPISVLNDAAARGYLAGSAFHGYSSTSGISNMTSVRNAYPDKGIWFTEISGGDWDTNFGSNLRWHTSNTVIANIRNWSKSVLLWNLALNTSHGPTNGGCSDCRGVVTVNGNNYAREVEYYILGHVSKFVDPGAVRIGSNTFSGGIENVAFKNPDGSKVLLALNNGSSSNTFKVQWGGQSFVYTLASGDVATFRWTGSGGGSGAPVGQTIWLRGSNNQYVSSENGQSAMMCNRPSVQGWEQFAVVDAGGGKIALRGSNNQYVSSENGQSGMICNRPAIGGWEAFDWVENSNGTISLRGNNSQYVSSEDGQSAMMCNRPAIGGWEQFTWGTGGGARMAEEDAGAIQAQVFRIYPNPVTGREFSIDLSGFEAVSLNLSISDLSGRTILEQPVNSGRTRVELPREMSAGMYLISISGDGQELSQKLVVE